MQQDYSASTDGIRKFVHTCPACNNRYRVSINVNILRMHRATCPHCTNINYFDNREKALQSVSLTEIPAREVTVTPPKKIEIPPTIETRPPLESLKQANAAVKHAEKFSPPAPLKKKKTTSIFRDRGPLFWIKPRNPSYSGNWTPSIDLPGRPVLFAIGGALIALPLIFFLTFLFIPSIYLPEGAESLLNGIDSGRENRILDRNGNLLSQLFSKKTGSMKFSQVPERMKAMLMFVEDEGFYKHGGVHWPSVVRAMAQNVISFGYRQGGSTLTQQLARIMLNARQKTLFRKVRETSLAYYLETKMSKDEILTQYINNVYLGHGAVGMDNAARFYFLKEPAELNFVETLALVCLPSSPETFSPIRYPDRLEKKMDVVYKRMVKEGFEFASKVSQEDYQKQKDAMLSSNTRSPTETVFGSREDSAPYVTEHVRLKIREYVGADSEFGAGLVVETTIDSRLQIAANSAAAEFISQAQNNFPPVRTSGGVAESDATKAALRSEYARTSLGAIIFGFPSGNESEKTSETTLQGAAIGIEPSSGAVLFMQGGRSFRRDNQINRAISMHRQTGSAIKPIIYSAGIESGTITAATRLDDSPIFVLNTGEANKEFWLPENITGEYKGKISAREALAQSRNVPAILVGRQVGLPRLSTQFKKFFFQDDEVYRKRFRMDETIAIGSLEMSPLEMAVAFGAFGDNGMIHRPYLIKRIKDSSGKVVYENPNGSDRDEFSLKTDQTRRAIPGEVAEVIASMIHESASFANTGVYSAKLIGKTGTTNSSRDAWFAGVLPGLSTAVWIGYDNPSYSIRGGMGARLAGPFYGRIISKSGFSPVGDYSFSPGAERIKICKESGLIAGPNCPTMTELFAGVKPEGICSLHDGRSRNREDHKDINRESDFQ